MDPLDWYLVVSFLPLSSADSLPERRAILCRALLKASCWDRHGDEIYLKLRYYK